MAGRLHTTFVCEQNMRSQLDPMVTLQGRLPLFSAGCECDDGRRRCGAAVMTGKRYCEMHAPVLVSAGRPSSRRRSH
jgi:hypothetical protein